MWKREQRIVARFLAESAPKVKVGGKDDPKLEALQRRIQNENAGESSVVMKKKLARRNREKEVKAERRIVQKGRYPECHRDL